MNQRCQVLHYHLHLNLFAATVPELWCICGSPCGVWILQSKGWAPESNPLCSLSPAWSDTNHRNFTSWNSGHTFTSSALTGNTSVYFNILTSLFLGPIKISDEASTTHEVVSNIQFVNNAASWLYSLYSHQRMNFTLSILFSMKSSNFWTASMFFPPYFSCPPWTGTSISTSRQDTGKLFSRLTAWLMTKMVIFSMIFHFRHLPE